IAQEEVFGPVLAVMRAKNFDEAIDLALSTRFALTGAVFSRSPENLAKARERFCVGNLYLNKGSTGAMVERQPFGGFQMSGVGSKTGGPDYLLQFLDPRCVTENTIRRGFTPIAEDDDWV
ncbi:aldehyde dehydrogenase family protein, partial [Desulfovibrio sp. OttesenSCG-928-M14]|nr:aldehyde dehydrogenase family protein [Desulfovibrio sp. OttesenSCG-928-M14]